MGGGNSGTSSEEDAARQPVATLLLTDAATPLAPCLDVAPDETDVLVVSASRSVRDVVSDWRASIGHLPVTFGLVTFAEFDRSATAAAETADRPSRQALPGSDITLTAMSDPGNLQRLGTAVTLYLDDWVDSDRETLVYVDALEPFIDANGLESVFQFLHLLVQSADQLDATLVVRLDPTTDDRTINTLRTLFDDIVDGVSASASPTPFDADTIHDLLGNPRRRFVLRSLFEETELGLERLAAQLARWENGTDDPTEDECTRAYTALASVHVPRLADAGVVTYDRTAERVCLSDAARDANRLERYLERASDDD
ncbi:MAG: hypothetical protein ABEJ73_06185 [Haloplanus sp.]